MSESRSNEHQDTRAATNGSGDTTPPEKSVVDVQQPAVGIDSVDVAALIAERDSIQDQFQRARADYVNLKRRVEQDNSALRQQAARDVLLQVLPVVDDFDRAMANAPEDDDQQSWISGTRMVGKKLLNVLERYGVRRFSSLNEPFDPRFHEAVASDPGSIGAHVVDVYQEGYLLGDNVLRPAMVKTGDAAANGNTSDTNEAGT